MGKPGLVNRPRTLAAAVALSVCSSAFAADMPINLPPPTPTRALPDEHPGFGWYIRGDLGYRFQHFAGASSSNAAQVPALSSSTLANDFVGGYGVGSQMQWLRVDVTGDYGGRSRFTGTTATGAPATALVETFTLMLNAYLDLGTWGGFTPYIGAGGGGA
jgi:opacity protein-like surface antigen